MDTPLATNIINSVVATGTLVVAIVAIVAIFQNRSQAREDWKHSQQLASDERQHQSRPIIVPIGEFEPVSPYMARGNTPYRGDGLVNWAYPDPIQLELQNMGEGVALNVHCVLYGSEPIHISQFISWDNGPIGKSPIHIKYEHPKQFFLNPDDSIDESHPLFDTSPNSPSNSTECPVPDIMDKCIREKMLPRKVSERDDNQEATTVYSRIQGESGARELAT